METIKDIAKRAGVSIAAVSKVLNYNPTLSVSDKTKKKIFQIAEDLSYRKKTDRRHTSYRIAIGKFSPKQAEEHREITEKTLGEISSEPEGPLLRRTHGNVLKE